MTKSRTIKPGKRNLCHVAKCERPLKVIRKLGHLRSLHSGATCVLTVPHADVSTVQTWPQNTQTVTEAAAIILATTLRRDDTHRTLGEGAGHVLRILRQRAGNNDADKEHVVVSHDTYP